MHAKLNGFYQVFCLNGPLCMLPLAVDDELDKAMKKGNVDVQGIDSILVGVGGAGKTHTLNMIVNRPTPTKRVSTTC